MEGRYILAIDQSTTGTKAVLFKKDCTVHCRVTLEHRQIHPRPEWVEHDPVEIASNVRRAMIDVLREGDASWSEVSAISLTNQRETGTVWDRETGKPIGNAVVWQCPRGMDICAGIEAMPDKARLVRQITGLHLSPYFTAPKIRWLLENVPGAEEKAQKGKLLFGTMDSWVLWQLTGGKVHATDYSNASRTMLFNIHDMKWDVELLELFGIPFSMMPEIKISDSIFGYTSGCEGIPDGIPVSGIMGDSHAALFGQNCFGAGMTKATYGTGSSVMMNIGGKPVILDSGIVTSIGWVCSKDTVYVLEGNINCTGKTIEWLVRNLGVIKSPREAGEIAAKLRDNGGVYFVPAFTGLGAPYWDNNARGAITGLSLGSSKEHIVRAAEESIAYQIEDIIDRMRSDSGIKPTELRADGGPTRDSFLMQFQSDISDTKVVVPEVEELSALGSANMAGLAVGFWSSRAEIEGKRTVLSEYLPKMNAETRESCRRGWQDAVRRAAGMSMHMI